MSDKRANILHVYHLIDVTYINVKIKCLTTLLDRHPNWQTINKQKNISHIEIQKREKSKRQKRRQKQNKRKEKQKQTVEK